MSQKYLASGRKIPKVKDKHKTVFFCPPSTFTLQGGQRSSKVKKISVYQLPVDVDVCSNRRQNLGSLRGGKHCPPGHRGGRGQDGALGLCLHAPR